MLTIAILLFASEPHTGGTRANDCHRDRKPACGIATGRRGLRLLQLLGCRAVPFVSRTALLLGLRRFVPAIRGAAASWMGMGMGDQKK